MLLSTLEELLTAFTDDEWRITFTSRMHSGRPAESQEQLFRTLPRLPASASLFSGGLDSLAGLSGFLGENPQHNVVVFSARATTRIAAHQRAVLRAVEQQYPGRIKSIAVQFGFRRRHRGAFDHDEVTQRARGLVFQLVGAVAARMAGLNELLIFENGIGAINLPYTAAQLGSQATRAAHPALLERVGAFLSLVFQHPFKVRLPYVSMTKGELCRQLVGTLLEAAVLDTVSCDGYPQRVRGVEQCGRCTSCVLRRQSLLIADLRHVDPSDLYTHDIYDPAAFDAWARRYHYRAMAGQVHHLEHALSASDTWHALTSKYPDLVEVAGALSRGGQTAEDPRDSLVALYRRYVIEWKTFAATVYPGRPSVGLASGHTQDQGGSSPAAPVTAREPSHMLGDDSGG